VDAFKFGSKGATKDRPRYRLLSVFITLIICAIAAIFAFASRPLGVPWIFVLFFLVVSGLVPILYMLLKYLLYYEREKAALVPPPDVTLEEERLVANGMFTKMFGNKIISMLVVPIFSGIVVDIFTRNVASPEHVRVATFTIWVVGFKFLAVFAVASIVAARVYQLYSGVFLYLFNGADTYTYAKLYAICRKEVGFRKALVFGVFVLNPPSMFAFGWFFVTGSYLLISKTIFL